MSADPLEDCLSFALEHSTAVGAASSARALFDRRPAASGDLEYRRAEPLFTADGRSVRAVKHAPLKRSLLDAEQERDVASVVAAEAKPAKRKKKAGERPSTSGESHFDLPNTPITPEIEKTFKLLEMRPYIFKDHTYKKSLKWKPPSYFGVGTVVDDAQDFYSTRVAKKERKQNLADEFLEDPALLEYVEKRQRIMDSKKAQLESMRRRKANPKKRAPIMYKAKGRAGNKGKRR